MTDCIKVKTVVLAQYFREDSINISHIQKPYGDYSDPVVRIDRLENGKTTGLVEIPYKNLQEVMDALNKAIDVNDSIPHSEHQAELKSDIGGGA